MISVNLIPTPRLQAKRRRIRLRRWTVAVAAYVLLLSATYMGCRFRWDTGRSLDATEMREVADEIAGYNRKIAAMKGASQAIMAKIEANQAVGNQPDWSVLLELVGKHLGPDVFLKYCKLDLARKNYSSVVQVADGQAGQERREFVFEVSGMGMSQTAVSQFVLRLENAGLFDKVKLINTRRERFMEGSAIAFQLACSLGAESRRLR